MKESNFSENNISSLVRLAKTGDPHAFSKLYEMFYKDMYKLAFYTLMHREDAEDVVSETVLAAYTSISKLKDENAFKSWIFTILSRKCSAKIKEYIIKKENEFSIDNTQNSHDTYNSNTDFKSDSPLNLKDESFDFSDKVINREVLSKGFKSLTREERLIVNMIVYGGYNSTQISEITGITSSTIRSKYSRALKKMKDAIGII